MNSYENVVGEKIGDWMCTWEVPFDGLIFAIPHRMPTKCLPINTQVYIWVDCFFFLCVCVQYYLVRSTTFRTRLFIFLLSRRRFVCYTFFYKLSLWLIACLFYCGSLLFTFVHLYYYIIYSIFSLFNIRRNGR